MPAYLRHNLLLTISLPSIVTDTTPLTPGKGRGGGKISLDLSLLHPDRLAATSAEQRGDLNTDFSPARAPLLQPVYPCNLTDPQTDLDRCQEPWHLISCKTYHLQNVVAAMELANLPTFFQHYGCCSTDAVAGPLARFR